MTLRTYRSAIDGYSTRHQQRAVWKHELLMIIRKTWIINSLLRAAYIYIWQIHQTGKLGKFFFATLCLRCLSSITQSLIAECDSTQIALKVKVFSFSLCDSLPHLHEYARGYRISGSVARLQDLLDLLQTADADRRDDDDDKERRKLSSVIPCELHTLHTHSLSINVMQTKKSRWLSCCTFSLPWLPSTTIFASIHFMLRN